MIERAVYSLWTSPMDGEHVGFNTEEALINCFKLSLHYAKKWFKEVHLVTDIKGKALVEKHGLEFDNINTDLEHVMKGVYKNHWSLGKIYACKIQDKPFMHIDIDVIWFKKPPQNILTSDASFQCIEDQSQEYWYKLLIDHADKHYKDKPSWFNCKEIKAYNCGFIGFNKLGIVSEWWDEAIKYIKYLDASGFDYNHHLSCLIYEQFVIYHLCKHKKYQVDVLSNHHSNSKGKGWLPEDAAKEIGYTHLIAASKRDKKIEGLVKRKLEKIKELTYGTSLI
jgi:hypothetical protein